MYVLCTPVPNIFITIRSSFEEMDQHVTEMQNSSLGKFIGTTGFFVFASSLYHLLYMSGQRLLAIQRPFLYRNQSSRTIVIHLAITWSITALGTTFARKQIICVDKPQDLLIICWSTVVVDSFCSPAVVESLCLQFGRPASSRLHTSLKCSNSW